MDSLSIINAITPPSGYETTSALFTTYSADLLACLVMLATLDNTPSESIVKPGKIQAFRALERFRDNVRIAVQQGRVLWNRGSRDPVLALLDRVVKPVRYDEQICSFHPKVILVRYQAIGMPNQIRYTLVVGSRNLTKDASLDFGAAFTGATKDQRTGPPTKLAQLKPFVNHVCKLIGQPKFASQFPDIARIRWSLPEGVTNLEFDYSPGNKRKEAHSKWKLFDISKRKQIQDMFVLSPFINAEMIKQSLSGFVKIDNKKLVSGLVDLEKVAKSKSRNALKQFNPYRYYIAPPEPLPSSNIEKKGENEEINVIDKADEERSDPIGLHAKIIAIRHGTKKTSILFGSPNFTSRAWDGRNCEAYCLIRANGSIADDIKKWADVNAKQFDVNSVDPDDTNKGDGDALEDLRKVIASINFLLYVDLKTSSLRLMSENTLPWAKMKKDKATLHVGLQTKKAPLIMWPKEKNAIAIGKYAHDEHTEFVRMKLTDPKKKIEWIQQVESNIPPDDERDKSVLINHLGISGFLAYIRSLLGHDSTTGDKPHNPPKRKPKDKPKDGLGLGENFVISLEDILKGLQKDPKLIENISYTLEKYKKLIQQLEVDQRTKDQKEQLQEFYKTWKEIETGWSMK